MRWEINGNVLIRVSDSEEESSEQRAKNKSFPHHWDKTQLNMHAEKWKFLSIGGAGLQRQEKKKKTWRNLAARSATCLLLFLCNKKRERGQMLGVRGVVAWLSISGFPLDFPPPSCP